MSYKFINQDSSNNGQFTTYTLAEVTAACTKYSGLANAIVSDGIITNAFAELIQESVKDCLSKNPFLLPEFRAEDMDRFILTLTTFEFKGDVQNREVDEVYLREFLIDDLKDGKSDSIEHALIEMENRKSEYPEVYGANLNRSVLLDMFFETSLRNGSFRND